METVFEVVALDALLAVEQVEELLHELGCHVHLERAHLNGLVDDELKEELVDALEVGPGGVHLLLLVDTGLGEVQVALLHVGQWAEDVLLNHLHHLIQVGDDHRHNIFLVLEHLLQLGDGVETLGLNEKRRGAG